MKKIEMNPELVIGDDVVLLHMHEEAVIPGLKGVVKSITDFANHKIYGIEWEDGRKLSLLSDVDLWTKPLKSKLEESDKNKWLSENLDIVNFDTSLLVNFLLKLRDSGVVNMFAAAPYLYMGKDRLEHHFLYHDFSDDQREKFEDVLDSADESQSAMINGVIKILEKEKKELDIDNINRYLSKYSQKLLRHYINVLS